MDIKKLNEEFNIIVETQIEYVDPIIAIKEGSYDGDDIGDIVLDNLDEFSVDELVNILNNYNWYCHSGVDKLFPSGFLYNDIQGEYPVKLAEAVAKCNDKEVITEIYNIFYRCHGDLTTWGNASKVWQKAMLEDTENLDMLIGACDDNEYYKEIMSELIDNMTDFAYELEEKLRERNPEFIEEMGELSDLFEE